jgi:hypothetical protein
MPPATAFFNYARLCAIVRRNERENFTLVARIVAFIVAPLVRAL